MSEMPDPCGCVMKPFDCEIEMCSIHDAAPDLLEALRSLIVARDLGFNPFAREISAARDAIAKADGKATV